MNQKWRTRDALVAAARELLRESGEPTIGEVAERARVSKATAYRYFPNQELLLLKARQVKSAPLQETIDERLRKTEDPAARIDIVADVINRAVAADEATGRALLRLYLDQGRGEDVNEHVEPAVLRGDMRIRCAEEALAPIHDRLGDEAFERLIMSLVLAIGIEAVILMRDQCELTAEEAMSVTRWAATALVRQALAEADATGNAPAQTLS